MTTDAHDEAVKAAAEAITPHSHSYRLNAAETRSIAATAVAAAAPILAAAERQRIDAVLALIATLDCGGECPTWNPYRDEPAACTCWKSHLNAALGAAEAANPTVEEFTSALAPFVTGGVLAAYGLGRDDEAAGNPTRTPLDVVSTVLADVDVPMSPDKGHDLRERIAQRIDQAWAEANDLRPRSEYRDGYLDGLEHAEAVARSTPLTVGVAPLDVEAPQYDRIERDASRTARAALVADLRALRSRSGYVLATDVLALLDRHAPTTGATP